jgi:hypothetical protein
VTIRLRNNARSTLATSISDNITTITVQIGHGARFPATAYPDDWFPVAVENALGEIEYMRCTARIGDALTVVRAQEGTPPRAFTAGAVVQLRFTAEAAENFMKSAIYDDGTPIEARKPAEVGATRGAPAGTSVAGRLAETVNNLTDLNAVNILEQALRQDDAQVVLDARTFVDGQPVNTVFATFRNEQVTALAALVSTLALLGAKTPDGTGWVLDLNTVRIGAGQTLAQKFTEIGAADAATNGNVSNLMEVVLGPAGQEARALVKARLNNNVATLVVGATGNESIIGFQADNTVIMSEDGTRVLAVFGEDVDGAYIPNLRVDRISIGAMDPEFTNNQGISTTQVSQKLPGGIIMKSGKFRAPINDEVSLSIVFDEPFPTECRSFVPVPFISVFSPFRDLWLQNVGEPTRFGAAVGTQSSTSNNQHLDGFDWCAFGI